jgi:16S rRNA (cytidine1402-2'-O)-methyltransferase
MALYVVATPIGNLEDVSARALRVLAEADWIAAEDTRRARKLLARHGIRARVISCFVGNEARRAPELAARLAAGETGALVSDAGTPGISDPGARLVRAALDAGARVIPVPGPSAITAALSASGFAADRFRFLGFPPARARDRNALLARAASEPDTVVLFESPRRVESTLAALAALAPDRPCAVFREITKLHEECVRGSLEEAAARVARERGPGEYAIVLGPREGPEVSRALAARADFDAPPGTNRADDVRAAMARRIAEGESLAQAARRVARELSVPRADAYRAGVALRQGRENG